MSSSRRRPAHRPAREPARGSHPLPPVVLVGIDSVQGLQVARVFAARAIRVIGVAKKSDYYSCKTRVCERIIYTDTGGDGLVETLITLAAELGEKAVLIPCQDKNVLVVSRLRDQLESAYHLMLPDHETVEGLIDKTEFYGHALSRGLPVPATAVLHSRADAIEAVHIVRFPAVLKPHYRSTRWSRHTKTKAIPVATADELVAAYDHHADWADSLLAQQYIAGSDSDLYTCNVVFDRQCTPVASFVSRKMRQWPPRLGQACSAVEYVDDEIAQTTIKFYEQAGLVGFGYLEIKRDPETGQLYAIEPNIGRPTGRSALAEAGGVELHMSLYCAAIGAQLPNDRVQKGSGVKWIHEFRDLQSAIYYIRRGRLGILEWLSSLRGRKAFAIFSWRDPMPFFYAMYSALPVFLSDRARTAGDYRREVD
jgi:D-aspartate ligase